MPSEIARPAISISTTPDGRTALGDLSGLDLFFVVDKLTLNFGIGPQLVNAYIQPEWSVQRPRGALQTPRFIFHLLYPQRG